MTQPVLLDITRSLGRRLRGATPSGIDRVCDAYISHYRSSANAVVQLRGYPTVLDHSLSKRLFAALDLPTARLRRETLAIMVAARFGAGRYDTTKSAVYLNVGHSDFDLEAHWRWVRRTGVKPVYLLHDLIPITHPHVTTPHKTARHRGRVVKALEGATGIIANSRATADELNRFAHQEGTAVPSLLTAPIGTTALPVPLHAEQPDTPVFVSIGTIERRKNHELLLAAWLQLIESMGNDAPRLILAGNMGLGGASVCEALEKNRRLGAFVSVRSGLDDAGLARLLSGATGVLLPSLAEGFGLPLVEALQRRIPVIASNIASAREQGGGIPTLLEPHDIQGWANAIRDMCGNGAERQRQLAMMGTFAPPRWGAHFAACDAFITRLSSDQDARAVNDLSHAATAGNGATKRDRGARC